MTSIVVFRNDLRLADNPALAAGAADGPVVPVCVSDDGPGSRASGAARPAWRDASLRSLARDLEARGSWLVVRAGDTAAVLLELARETGAGAVHWNRRYGPDAAADDRVRAVLEDAGLAVRTHPGTLLREPDDVLTSSGRPYQVFTPFHRANERMAPPGPPLPAPGRLRAPDVRPAGGVPPASTGVAPDLSAWAPGEAGARARAKEFLAARAERYDTARERPDLDGTSRLSPHLAFGEISPRQVWHLAAEVTLTDTGPHAAAGIAAFIRQLYWREFAYHLLHHYPHTAEQPLRRRFEAFPWMRDDAVLDAWKHGQTGYPLVDAGMRQLRATGWMHNRVRMVVASFLTKDLLLPWQDGAGWFRERLTDADTANNAFGWQWVAGCGADAAPYFRVFNPVAQGERYDPDGAYVKRWVPELEAVPARWVHKPWLAPGDVRAAAGLTLGRDYPAPIIDHAEARARALAIYYSLRDAAG